MPINMCLEYILLFSNNCSSFKAELERLISPELDLEKAEIETNGGHNGWCLAYKENTCTLVTNHYGHH